MTTHRVHDSASVRSQPVWLADLDAAPGRADHREPPPDFVARLADWVHEQLPGCGDGAIREAHIVLGELLTNAYRHARPPYHVRLLLLDERTTVRIEVDDAMPAPRRQWPLGKGLLVVRGLCPHWGVAPLASGKTVWAELPLLAAPNPDAA